MTLTAREQLKQNLKQQEHLAKEAVKLRESINEQDCDTYPSPLLGKKSMYIVEIPNEDGDPQKVLALKDGTYEHSGHRTYPIKDGCIKGSLVSEKIIGDAHWSVRDVVRHRNPQRVLLAPANLILTNKNLATCIAEWLKYIGMTSDANYIKKTFKKIERETGPTWLILGPQPFNSETFSQYAEVEKDLEYKDNLIITPADLDYGVPPELLKEEYARMVFDVDGVWLLEGAADDPDVKPLLGMAELLNKPIYNYPQTLSEKWGSR